jgi:ribosomal protein L37E
MNFYENEINIEPCSECPYPMNVLIIPHAKNNEFEKFKITCRECGETWIESKTKES